MTPLRKPLDLPREDRLIIAALLLAVLAVFLQVHAFSFVNFDDPTYVTENPQVLRGLSLASIRWAFTNLESANWHPLSWLSHQVDISLFGLRPGAHHLVNVALHGANSALVFLLLRALTGSRWRSALVAALFALHPCHVESVAWISERKDVLCAFFWLLTTLAYRAWVQAPSRRRYGVLLGSFALTLMAKPMGVTLPVTLLLLDFWPLDRLRTWADLRPRLQEKLPLFTMVLALSGLTLLAQHQGGAVSNLQEAPLASRLSNALLSGVGYLAHGLWPSRLAVFYPFPRTAPPAWKPLGAAALLLVLSALVLRQREKRPWLLAGWAWYVITLLPVIGIIQVGGQSMADRYTYLPFLGPFLMVAWTLGEAAEHRLLRPPMIPAAAGACLVLLGSLAARQTATWRDTYTLFRHAAQVTSRNTLAELNVAYALEERGQDEEAARTYRHILEYAPRQIRAGLSLGQIRERQGRLAEALECYRSVLAAHPDHLEAQALQAQVLMRLGQDGAAAATYARLQQARPAQFAEGPRGEDLAAASHLNFAILLLRHRHPREALLALQAPLRRHPLGTGPQARLPHQLAIQALLDLGRSREAASLCRQTLAFDEPQPEAWFCLGQALLLEHRQAEAEQAFQRTLALAPQHPGARKALQGAPIP